MLHASDEIKPTSSKPEGTAIVTPTHTPRAHADEVTAEQAGIYVDESPAQTDGLVTNEPKEFDPRMMGAAEPGPLELPPADAGYLAREKLKVKDRSLKARARRMWNWIKFICFLTVLVVGALLYWQYTERKHTYVVEPRICLFETADKQVRLTGTRYYSYTQNEMLGVRWAHNDETTVKTELDIKGSAMVIASLGGPDGPTSKYISQGEQGKEVLPVAETYVITFDKRSVVLNASTFCR